MTTPPDFVAGSVLTAAQMNAIGLWETKSLTTSATPVSSVDVTSCFTTDYDTYFVSFTATTNGVLAAHGVQLLSGTTASTTGYYYNYIVMNSGSNTVTGTAGNNQSTFYVGEQAASAGIFRMWMIVQNPFQAEITKLTSDHSIMLSGPVNYQWRLTGMHNVATSYDGFKFLAGAQTFNTATIRVYGYRK